MGEIAALSVSFCWAITSIFLTSAGEKLGSMVVNRIRLVFAVILLTTAHLFLKGQLFPFDANQEQLLWLSLSGVVGLVLGDGFLIKAYLLVGVRIGTLIMSSVPVISTLFAWVLLGEKVKFFELSGIFLTMFGIMIVVSDRNSDERIEKDKKAIRNRYFICLFRRVWSSFWTGAGEKRFGRRFLTALWCIGSYVVRDDFYVAHCCVHGAGWQNHPQRPFRANRIKKYCHRQLCWTLHRRLAFAGRSTNH